MRVRIGPYKTWIGPYQLADMIPFISDGQRHQIGEWLADTWVNNVCHFFDRQKKRKVQVHIDRWDTWNMDHTLALIVLPMLKQLKETKHGSPYVDDEDVPEFIRSTTAPPRENEWDTDAYHFIRWEWVLEEMIFAFENILEDDWTYSLDKETRDMYNDRVENGLRLFGKYYRALWD